MDSSNEPSDWIPTSFSNTAETTEGDSLSSYHSVTTPGSSAIDQQSDDQSFDAVSRHKLNLTITSNIGHDRSSPRSPRVPGMSMFEEDTRSSWSVEPKPTHFKESSLDDDSRNSISSPKGVIESSSDMESLSDQKLQFAKPTQEKIPNASEQESRLVDQDLRQKDLDQKHELLDSGRELQLDGDDHKQRVEDSASERTSQSVSDGNITSENLATDENLQVNESMTDPDIQLANSVADSDSKSLESVPIQTEIIKVLEDLPKDSSSDLKLQESHLVADEHLQYEDSNLEKESNKISSKSSLPDLDLPIKDSFSNSQLESKDSILDQDHQSPHSNSGQDVQSPHSNSAQDVQSPHSNSGQDVQSPHSNSGQDVQSQHSTSDQDIHPHQSTSDGEVLLEDAAFSPKPQPTAVSSDQKIQPENPAPVQEINFKESVTNEELKSIFHSDKKSLENPPSIWNVEPVPPKIEESLSVTSINNVDSCEKIPEKTPSVWNIKSTLKDSNEDITVEETAMDDDSQNSTSCNKSTEDISSCKGEEAMEDIAMDDDSQLSASCSKDVEDVSISQENSSVWDVKEMDDLKETPMDEDSQISTSSQKSQGKALDSPRISSPFSVEPKSISAALNEESQSSIKSQSSQKSSKRQRILDEDTNGVVTPENLLEYMWPQENGEFYILQEQICDYLNIKSFKRKYPDLARRSVDMDEKQFLKEKGVVTEMQCDLGLAALRSEEVLELMSKDYPDQYKEYIRVLRDREKQSITEKHKEFIATNSDKTKMVDLVKKAIQSAAEYNAHLNQERREERRSSMDLQTFTIHYPARKSSKPKANTKPGKYPVALLPGQFQDYYKDYTPNELKYLPLNTVLYGPLKELQSTKAMSDGSHSDSEDSSVSDGSDCSSSQGTHDDSSSSSEKNENGQTSSASERNGNSSEPPYRPKVKPNAVCKVCKKGPEGKLQPEELVHCAECDNSAHPSCIELTTDVVNVLKTYPWQCMDCKVCSHCTDPNDEDKMLFCDFCDRGYHTFCVGLKSLPQGKWVCRRCGSCSICGATKPGPETSKAQWLYDSSKGVVELDANRRPKIMCQSCFKKKR